MLFSKKREIWLYRSAKKYRQLDMDIDGFKTYDLSLSLAA